MKKVFTILFCLIISINGVFADGEQFYEVDEDDEEDRTQRSVPTAGCTFPVLRLEDLQRAFRPAERKR